MTTFLMLPDDLILNCLARVSRLYYPTLSLVSKRLRSFLTSMQLYRTRTLLGRTESCLYVYLRNHKSSIPLSLHQILLNNSRKVLAPISSPDTLPMHLPHYIGHRHIGHQHLVVVGHNIYVIGGQINNKASSSVMVMDCRSHTWREAPNMQVARDTPSACVLDGKIYVVGGCENLDITIWMEVFDTKTQTWEFVSGPFEYLNHWCIECDGKVYAGSMMMTYELHEGTWREAVGMESVLLWPHCVIDNVLYRMFYRSPSFLIFWFDSERRYWRQLMGVTRLTNYSHVGNIMMANCGGKIAILWEEYVYDEVRRHRVKKVRCVEITIDKRCNGEIWGTTEWVDVVATNNGGNEELEYAFVATL